jgi:hypothetical protein
MDEQIELKDKKINILEKELKDVNDYDEQKIQTLLNKKPVIRNNNKERVKRYRKLIFNNNISECRTNSN